MVLTKKIKRIHFVGIGGAGVSALANLMLEMGYEVSGSDLLCSAVTEGLKRKGAIIFEGHDARHVHRANLVITSTAIPESNVEIVTAKQLSIPVLTRTDFLSYLSQRKFSISVSGSHGKSTTCAMISVIFYYADLDPTIVLGAQVKHLFGSSRLGRSEYFVCEGDESNNSMLRFSPTIAVVTNVDDDHLDFHGSLENLKQSFLNFLDNATENGTCVYNLDDPILAELGTKLTRPKKITYGISSEATIRAQAIKILKNGTRFKVFKGKDKELGEVRLRIPGIYNVRNALGAIAVSDFCGIDFGSVAFGLENFPGISRRYEKLIDRDDLTIIDDYAHHPSEIAELLSAVRATTSRRIRVVFQPHRYTRSQRLAAKFPPAFQACDEVILTEIYSAFEPPIDGVTTEYLYSFFEHEYSQAKAKLMLRRDEILSYLKETAQYGDIIMTVGAGDIYQLGYELQGYFKDRRLGDKPKPKLKQSCSPSSERKLGSFDSGKAIYKGD